MKRNYIHAALLLLGSYNCFAQHAPFFPLDTNAAQTVFVHASPLKYEVLCVANDSMAYNAEGVGEGIKGNFAGISYIGVNNANRDSSGTIFVNNNINKKSAVLGDGGGMTQFKVKRNAAGKWAVLTQTVASKRVYFRNVDFSTVGGTVCNNGLAKLETGGLLTCEDSIMESNTDLKGFTDLADYTIPAGTGTGTTIPKYKNMNWVTEVNPNTLTATKKHYSLGRFKHKGIAVSDLNAVFMSSGGMPSVLFQFIPTNDDDLSSGILYFHKSTGWTSLDTIAASQDFPTVESAREKALQLGATMFANLEGLAIGTDYFEGEILYMAEKGVDDSGDYFSNTSLKYQGEMAAHLKALDTDNDGNIKDPYGRILQMNTLSTYIGVLVEGGKANTGDAMNKGYGIVKPTSLETVVFQDVEMNNHYMLVLKTSGSSAHASNYAYWLEYSRLNENGDDLLPPSLNELKLGMIGPKGSTLSGGSFNSSGDTYFASIHTPNASNPAPFNKSMVIAVTGFDKLIVTATEVPVFTQENTFQISPNPASRMLHFNQTTDVVVYTVTGVILKVAKETNQLDISDLKTGMYFIQNKDKEVKKLQVE